VGWTPPQSSAERYHRGWTGAGRSEIIRHLVVTIDPFENLSSLAHGAAVSVAEIMAASSAHITLIVEDQFCDLVNVGELGQHEVTFPVNRYYPLDSFPAAAERLLSHRGYLSTDTLAVVTEYVASLPGEVPACFMGVPIIAQGRVFGELLLCRREGQPTFTPEDLELAMDLATVLGSRIPGVLAMEDEAATER
jgi:GAF domain-containing protein